ncbi:protein NRT1/ PTR FAMILY 2.7-like [Melia azedarach]|uniref:Protein NRT1/ PTR FAMILY 2.7-like n=1 Tax=Melia azedarach TaxID=155640 RepID=A0ACC1YSE2_MELAZ|nr:protein NRT1/ PTR FAMILY 2.7-like [Melia azedarach]
MAVDGESEHLARNNIDSASFSADREAQISDVVATAKRGGWITFPFIAGTIMGMQLSNNGWSANLIVYLIQEFNISSIKAADIANVVNGCTLLFPVVGGIIADSFSGSFTVVSTSTFASLLGIILLTLTASLDSLRPQRCEILGSSCDTPSTAQYTILYGGIALSCIGIGGARFTLSTMGANQFDKPEHQGIFFNWFFIVYYAASVISTTIFVYVEDNVSWTVGFGLCVAANFAAFVIFLLGKRFYRHDKPQGSPFLALARVIVATILKWKVVLSSRTEDYYQENNATINAVPTTLNKNFRFLNRAAFKIEGDIGEDGSIAKPWRLCSVQQVEDLKTLIKLFPLWSSSLMLSITIGVQSSMTVLQALTMDRHLGPHFKIPAGSILVIVFFASSVSLTLIDRLVCPLWQKLTRRTLTPLQKTGVGHIFTVASMIVAALIEKKRLKIAHNHQLQDQLGSIVPMLSVWLFPQLILAGIGEAFYLPGQISLYYEEFPVSLRSTATGMIALILGIGFYLSTALTDIVGDVTTWLPDNINSGKLDNFYWTLAALCAVNFGYYLVCSCLYKYRNVNKGLDGNSGSLGE